jgi:hypothetical protein
MDFDFNALLLSFLFSAVGFVYFSFGRRTINPRVMLTGMVLMGYSYFTPTPLWTLGIGAVLTALPFILKWW